ncbi:type III-A CRISPR-associated RAMP protein Csm5 [Pseudothermotoga thermarum]|uniref:CRISPR system Cms protein Csm5 n=1 Tax=Pseudothermotoga thermarum DSM 5069 TaxID=688269 RepID=F7YTN1_9THEM|nr:type III-A CRISPR-associated RAMP protein Csm5 [Pseudothermotoga thermarum]AEH51253.1 CRISPR-associated RAMP protein, Csm5 family [Pseudothermotoga thermarum DSM 5069]
MITHSKTYEITVLTPLFICSDLRDKLTEIDFFLENGKIVVIDFDKLLSLTKNNERLLDEILLGLEGSVASFDLKRILQKYQIKVEQCKRYAMNFRGTFPSGTRKEIACFVKTAGKVYIPGSSLKGAIRSFITKALQKKFIALYDNEIARVKTNDKISDAGVERQVFGDPYASVFKYLQISDSNPISPENLEVFEVKILNICNGRAKWYAKPQNVENPKDALSNFVEGLPSKMSVTGSIKIDPQFVEKLKEKVEVQVDDPVKFLAKLINHAAKHYIENEMNFYKKYGIYEIADLYQKILDNMPKLRENEFILQVGFSTGYLSKTVGMLLKPDSLKRVAEIAYRNAKPELFPKTRRIVFNNGKILAIPGWIRVKIM